MFNKSGTGAGSPLRLKWPNDVLLVGHGFSAAPALSDSQDASATSSARTGTKLAGVLCESEWNMQAGGFTVLVGVGVNVDNPAPTVSLNHALRRAGAPPTTREEVLASFYNALEPLWAEFNAGVGGFTPELERRYRAVWLHERERVTLGQGEGQAVMIEGVDGATGMLRASVTATGEKVLLNPDEFSFDLAALRIHRKHGTRA